MLDKAQTVRGSAVELLFGVGVGAGATSVWGDKCNTGAGFGNED